LIEAVMYFVLGLLAAGLIALALTPAVWRRAHRLARARVESSLPMSLGEVQAEKDQLRASYAMSARRLELQLAEMKETARAHTVASSRYKGEIAALTSAGGEKDAAIAALEAQLAATAAEVKLADERTGAARSTIAARDATIVEHSRRIATLETQLEQVNLLIEEQRLELVARDTTIGNLEDQLAAARVSEAAVAAARDEVTAALAASQAALAGERKRGEGLAAQIAALGVERADRLASLDRRATELAAFEAEIARGREERAGLAATIAALEVERAARLAEIAERTEAVVQGGAVTEEAGDNMRKALASIEAEKAMLEARIAALEAERAATLAETAPNTQSPEPADGEALTSDAAIRARLAEIAATVLQFTRAGGGPADPGARADKANGNGNAAGHLHAVPGAGEGAPATEVPAEGEEAKADGRTLAERIRSLQQVARH
jgi:chromosome segregation ATPase